MHIIVDLGARDASARRPIERERLHAGDPGRIILLSPEKARSPRRHQKIKK